MTARPAITLRERLDEARAELWLCRLACDLTLARWAPTVVAEADRTPMPPTPSVQASVGTEPAAGQADAPPAEPGAGAGDAWPTWQPLWLHERCRPHPVPLLRVR